VRTLSQALVPYRFATVYPRKPAEDDPNAYGSRLYVYKLVDNSQTCKRVDIVVGNTV